MPLDVRGASRAAGLALLALAGVPLLGAILLVIGQPALGVGGFLGLVGAGMAGAMGASVDVSVGVGPIGGGFSLSIMPLTGTLAALVTLGIATANGLPRAGGPANAVVRHLALTLGIFLAGLLAAALIGQTALDAVLAGGLPGAIAGAEISLGLTGMIVTAMFLGAGAMAIAVAWLRRELLPPGLRSFADRLAGPAIAVRTALVLVAMATVLVAVVVAFAGPTDADGSATSRVAGTIAVAVSYLPNLVLLVLGFGSGVPITVDLPGLASPLAATGGLPTSVGLTDLLTADGNWWFVPVVVGGSLLVGAGRMALTAPDERVALSRGWTLAPVWAAVLLGGAVLTGISAEGTLPVPVLGRLSLTGSVHLDYGIALVAGLGWGLVAGVAGALLARALPPNVVAGLRNPVPGRRTATVVGAIAVLCAFTVPMAWAAVGGALPTPIPPPTPTPTYYPTYPTPTYDPDPYRTNRAGPTPAPVSTETVQLAAAATAHPSASSVQALLGSYYDAINARDYAAWSRVVTAKVAADQPQGLWERSYSTTQDDRIVVDGISTSAAGDALADVSFRSTQDPAYAPKDLPVASICWRMTYPVDTDSGEIGPALKGSVRKSAC